jgi:hypothetical protein
VNRFDSAKVGDFIHSDHRKFDLHWRSNAYAAGSHSLCKSYPQVCPAPVRGYDRPRMGLCRSSLRVRPRYQS